MSEAAESPSASHPIIGKMRTSLCVVICSAQFCLLQLNAPYLFLWLHGQIVPNYCLGLWLSCLCIAQCAHCVCVCFMYLLNFFFPVLQGENGPLSKFVCSLICSWSVVQVGQKELRVV